MVPVTVHAFAALIALTMLKPSRRPKRQVPTGYECGVVLSHCSRPYGCANGVPAT
jgi:hypothetical protein